MDAPPKTLTDVDLIGSWLFARSETGIFTFDRSGRVLRANPHMLKLLGSPDEETTTTFNVFSLPTMPDRLREVMSRVLDTGEMQSIDTDYVSMHGRKSSLRATFIPVKEDGEVVGALCHALDISHQKQVEDQLRRTGKMESLSLLAGTLAHDLNNIFTTLLGFSSILAHNGDLQPERRDKALSMVHKAATSGARLVEQLLGFASERQAQDQACEFSKAFEQAVSLFSYGLSPNINLEASSLFPSDGLVRGSITKIEQIILNLAINARDAIGEGQGEIKVLAGFSAMATPQATPRTGDPRRGYARVTITDNGTGISRENLPKIFDPYFSTKATGRGTGLGLSSVWGILRELGGRVHVDSTPGEGSRFDVFLPVATPDERFGQGEVAKTVSVQSRGQRVLVVENDPEVRELLVWILQRNAFKALEADSCSSGAQILDNVGSAVECVIADFDLPSAQLAILDDALKGTGIPVLYLTGSGRMMPRREGSLALRKPFRPKHLLETLARLLNG